MYISRNSYLEKLKQSIGNGMIKIITGPRRAGKSFLLFHIFKDYLLNSGVKDDHIIKISLDDSSNTEYRNPIRLDSYFKDRIKDKEKYYFFIDEIQFCRSIDNPAFDGFRTTDGTIPQITFYDVLNGFLKLENAEVFVTGSNSHMLSSDIATEFRGRGWQIRVHPLSFKEFKEANQNRIKDNLSLWDEYYLYGGLPQISLLPDEPSKREYLRQVFDNTYINDIVDRYSLRNDSAIRDLVKVIASNVGSIVNPTKIANTYKSEMKTNIQPITVSKYIEHMEDSFLINTAKKYDMTKRKFIGGSNKYYFEDMGLRYAASSFLGKDQEPHYMENVIYNELIARGYNVSIGVIPCFDHSTDKTARMNLEVDFIAEKFNEIIYIQSALYIQDDDKMEQELRPLKKINNSFKKIIITKYGGNNFYDKDGILHMNLFGFPHDDVSLN